MQKESDGRLGSDVPRCGRYQDWKCMITHTQGIGFILNFLEKLLGTSIIMCWGIYSMSVCGRCVTATANIYMCLVEPLTFSTALCHLRVGRLNPKEEPQGGQHRQ